jgi:Tfp pilus assembly protein PilO
MPRNSSVAGSVAPAKSRDPKVFVRSVVGALLAANVVAAGLILFPPGGSAESLARQMGELQVQLAANRTALEQTRQHAAQVEEGRAEGDKFLTDYFLPLRTSDNALDSELQRAATASKIKSKGTNFSHEPIEGSDTLQMVSITANYEGAYADILKFVHAIDQTPRLLIIESLSAVPQQGSTLLSVSMKIDAFVRGDDEE